MFPGTLLHRQQATKTTQHYIALSKHAVLQHKKTRGLSSRKDCCFLTRSTLEPAKLSKMRKDSRCDISDSSLDLSSMSEDAPSEWSDDIFNPIDDDREDSNDSTQLSTMSEDILNQLGHDIPGSDEFNSPKPNDQRKNHDVQKDGDASSQPSTALDAALPRENPAAIIQGKENNEVNKKSVAVQEKTTRGKMTQGKSVAEIEKALEEARNKETWKKSVDITRVTWTEKKRVTFSDGVSMDAKGGLEDGPGRNGEEGDVESVADNHDSGLEDDPNGSVKHGYVESEARSEEEVNKGVREESGSETEDSEDDDCVKTRHPTGRPKKFVTASPKTKTISSGSSKAPTSKPAAPPSRKSPGKLEGQKSDVAMLISDDETELSDPGSDLENPNDHSTRKTLKYTKAEATPEKTDTPKKYNTRSKTIVQDTHTKTSSYHAKPKASRSKNTRCITMKKDKTKERAAVPDSEDNVDKTNTLTISKVQMSDAILNLFTTSLQVYRQFVAYSSERDGEAAGGDGPLQKNTRPKAQRKRERDVGASGDAPSTKKSKRN